MFIKHVQPTAKNVNTLSLHHAIVMAGLTLSVTANEGQAATLQFTVIETNVDVAEPTGTDTQIVNIGPTLTSDNENWDRACTVSGTVSVTQGAESTDYRILDSQDFTFNTTPIANGESFTFETLSQEIRLEVLADFEEEDDEEVDFIINNVTAECDNGEGSTNVIADINNRTPFGYGLTITIQDTFNEPDDPIGEIPDTTLPAEQISLQSQIRGMHILTLHTAALQTRRLSAEISRARKGNKGINTNNLQVRINNQATPIDEWLNTVNTHQHSAAEETGMNAGDTLTDFGRWGFFVNGTIDIGESNITSASGSDYDSSLLLFGTDYQVNTKFLLGGAIGLTNLNSDSQDSTYTTDFDRTTLSLFGSYYSDTYYLDAILGYGDNSYDLSRKVIDDTIIADADGKEINIAFGAGYQIYLKSSSLNLFSVINYIDAGVNTYQEFTTGTAATAQIDSFNSKSLTSSFGAEISWSINTSIGVFSPQISLAWEHQFEDTPVSISGNLITEATTQEFVFDSTVLDNNYFNTQIGITGAFKGGVTSYLTYESYVDRDDIESNVYSFGVRWQF